MGWPTLPDGTVDWMSVFQAPDNGLIALIGQANTSKKLKNCFTFTINSLFSRDADKDIRQSYADILEKTFQGASALDAQKTKIRMVMLRLMNDRMKKSRENAATETAESDDEPKTADEQFEAVES